MWKCADPLAKLPVYATYRYVKLGNLVCEVKHMDVPKTERLQKPWVRFHCDVDTPSVDTIILQRRHYGHGFA